MVVFIARQQEEIDQFYQYTKTDDEREGENKLAHYKIGAYVMDHT